jgi:hypothetical protein
MANEDNWADGMGPYDRSFWYERDGDFKGLNDWLNLKKEELGRRIGAWWNSFYHDINFNSFEECLEEVLYCYVEKDFFRKNGFVDSLKEWRKERSSCYQIISYMNKRLKKEVLECYKGCRDDPGMLAIPNEPRLEAWKSYSIVSMDVNYFGFGDEESWLNFVDKLGEEFYEEYLKSHEKLVKGEILGENRIRDPYFHRWENSTTGEKFRKEMRYRGWFKNYYEDIGCDIFETFGVIRGKLKDYKGDVWEARVPKCSDICGKFILDVDQFIVETVKQRINNTSCYTIDEPVLEVCKEFAEDTCNIVWKEQFGNYNEEAVIKFLTDEKCRTNLKKKMADMKKLGETFQKWTGELT